MFKDISNLIYIANHYGLFEVSEYWQKVIAINDWQTRRISKIIVEKLFNTISCKKISILGLPLRQILMIQGISSNKICKELLEENCKISIYDPKVSPLQIENDLQINQSTLFSNNDQAEWTFSDSVLDATKNSDAILVLTEWEEFKNINWPQVYKYMRKPAWLFDARSIVDIKKVKLSGINLWQIGKGVS